MLSNTEESNIKMIDQIDDRLWTVIQDIALTMGVFRLTNDEFNNEQIMFVRHHIEDQLKPIKEERGVEADQRVITIRPALMETIADISFVAGDMLAKGLIEIEDSREGTQQFILWAQEFESIHKDTDWDLPDNDYIIAVDEFSSAKITERYSTKKVSEIITIVDPVLTARKPLRDALENFMHDLWQTRRDHTILSEAYSMDDKSAMFLIRCTDVCIMVVNVFIVFDRAPTVQNLTEIELQKDEYSSNQDAEEVSKEVFETLTRRLMR